MFLSAPTHSGHSSIHYRSPTSALCTRSQPGELPTKGIDLGWRQPGVFPLAECSAVVTSNKGWVGSGHSTGLDSVGIVSSAVRNVK